uniref:Uncharacterized protein n=1 Tax=Parascaris equorum TaxID=6256 RepID=A0A914RP01_PAREQ
MEQTGIVHDLAKGRFQRLDLRKHYGNSFGLMPSIYDILVTGYADRVASGVSDQRAGAMIVTVIGRPVGSEVVAEASVAEIVPVEAVVTAPVGVGVP